MLVSIIKICSYNNTANSDIITIKYYHPEGTQYVLKSVDVTLGKKN